MVSKTMKWSWKRTKSFKQTADKIAYIFCLIIAVFFSFMTFNSLDTTPATLDDYLPLYENLLSAEENPANMLNSDGTIIIKDGTIEYTVENQKCTVTGIYDQGNNLISKKQKDKSPSVLDVILYAILMGVLAGTVFYFVSYFLILCLAMIVYSIYGIASKKEYQDEDEKNSQSDKLAKVSTEENHKGYQDEDKKNSQSDKLPKENTEENYKGYETEMNTG